MVADEDGDLYYEEPGLGEGESVESNPIICNQDPINEDEYADMPDLISEPGDEARTRRNCNPPARLNPATGQNYMTKGESTQRSGSKAQRSDGSDDKRKELPKKSQKSKGILRKGMKYLKPSFNVGKKNIESGKSSKKVKKNV